MWPGFHGRSREPKAAEPYLGVGPAVVLTALGEGKFLRSRRVSRAWDDFLGVAENGDGVGLGTGAGSLAGFELAVEDESGIGEFFRREVKKISAGPRPVRAMSPMPFSR